MKIVICFDYNEKVRLAGSQSQFVHIKMSPKYSIDCLYDPATDTAYMPAFALNHYLNSSLGLKALKLDD
jgi:hypothetical protein